MPSSFSETTVFTVAEGVVSEGLGEEAIVLNMDDGSYYSLGDVGRFVWEQIQQSSCFGEIHRSLLREFKVESDRCENDLASFLEQLLDRGLLKIDGIRGGSHDPQRRRADPFI